MKIWIGEEKVVANEYSRLVKLFPFDSADPDAKRFPDTEFLESFYLFEFTKFQIFGIPFVEAREVIFR